MLARRSIAITSLLFCVAWTGGCQSATSTTQGTTGRSSGINEDEEIRVRLQEVGKGLKGRFFREVRPVARLKNDPNGETVPTTVDGDSRLRLSFESAVGNDPSLPSPARLNQIATAMNSVPKYATDFSLNVKDISTLADAHGDLVASMNTAGLIATPIRGGAEATPSLETLCANLAKLVADANAVIAAADRGVIVEAFLLSGDTSTALPLPGYNKVGSGENENETKKADPPAKEAVTAARSVIENAQKAAKQLRDSATQIRSTANNNPTQNKVANTLDKIATSLDAADPVVVPHGVKNLTPAEINLNSHGIKPGDVLKVNVSTVKTDADGSMAANPDRQLVDNFIVNVDRIGWHRKDSVAAILGRADSAGGSTESSADANDWKISLAATFNWSYYDDPNDPTCSEVYNWLQPGLGVHLAALDQTDDTLEFGLGVQVSLWDGLLFFGTGANLSADENRTYWMIGGDILGWRDRLAGNGDK